MPDQKLDQLLSASERIEYQVARIAEATTEFRFDLAEIKALIQQQSIVAQQQAETAARLAASVDKQAAAIERQAQIVERLLGDRL